MCDQVLAEYNKSVICFENALRIQPNYEAASRCRHAVLCHAKLEAVLETQHRSVLNVDYYVTFSLIIKVKVKS